MTYDAGDTREPAERARRDHDQCLGQPCRDAVARTTNSGETETPDAHGHSRVD